MKRLFIILLIKVIAISFLTAQPDIDIFRKQILINHIREPFMNPLMATVYVEGNKIGAGVILTEDGYILTAAHLVSSPGTIAISLSLSPSEVQEATLVYEEEMLDLAIIKIDIDLILPVIEWSEDEVVMIGDEVFLTGSPFGFGWTLSQGLVSSLRLDANGVVYIQTDANATLGSSGGGLFNEEGEFIGLLSFAFFSFGSFSQPVSLGLSWAISSGMIKVFSVGVIKIHRMMVDNLRGYE